LQRCIDSFGSTITIAYAALFVLLQNRHATGMNVSVTVFKYFFVLPDCHSESACEKDLRGGYLAIPRKEYAVCRTVYMESDNKDFDSDHFSAAMMFRLAAKSGLRGCSDLQ
jgi:hypothetical protein